MSKAEVVDLAEARSKMPFVVKQSLMFGPPDHFYGEFQAKVPAGTKPEELLMPEAWAQVANRFQSSQQTSTPERRGSTILVMTEDLEWRAIFMVLSAEDHGLQVRCIGPIIKEDGTGLPQYLRARPLPKQDPVSESKFKPRWNVGAGSWDVLRLTDKTVVSKDHATKELALAWIERQPA